MRHLVVRQGGQVQGQLVVRGGPQMARRAVEIAAMAAVMAGVMSTMLHGRLAKQMRTPQGGGQQWRRAVNRRTARRRREGG